MNIKRGEIYFADITRYDSQGSEQSGRRPVVILQNDIGNKFSPTTIIAIITTKSKRELPTHVELHKDRFNGLKQDSVVALEQIKTIDKERLEYRIGKLSPDDNIRVMEAMKISLAMI
jgi:mRNA interferase MazF